MTTKSTPATIFVELRTKNIPVKSLAKFIRSPFSVSSNRREL